MSNAQRLLDMCQQPMINWLIQLKNRIKFLVTDVWCYYIYVMSISKLHAYHCVLNGASIIGFSHMTIVMYANIFPSIDQHTYHATHTTSMETSGEVSNKPLCINGPILKIPQCTCPISNNAPLRTEMCTFLLWMVCCGIWGRCIVEFVN